MTRQLEQKGEDRAARRNTAALRAIKGGLASTLSRSGYDLRGFSYKDRGYDHLLVLKCDRAGDPRVAFVGADSLAGTFVKAMRLADRGKLVFRADQYAGPN